MAVPELLVQRLGGLVVKGLYVRENFVILGRYFFQMGKGRRNAQFLKKLDRVLIFVVLNKLKDTIGA